MESSHGNITAADIQTFGHLYEECTSPAECAVRKYSCSECKKFPDGSADFLSSIGHNGENIHLCEICDKLRREREHKHAFRVSNPDLLTEVNAISHVMCSCDCGAEMHAEMRIKAIRHKSSLWEAGGGRVSKRKVLDTSGPEDEVKKGGSDHIPNDGDGRKSLKTKALDETELNESDKLQKAGEHASLYDESYEVAHVKSNPGKALYNFLCKNMGCKVANREIKAVNRCFNNLVKLWDEADSIHNYGTYGPDGNYEWVPAMKLWILKAIKGKMTKTELLSEIEDLDMSIEHIQYVWPWEDTVHSELAPDNFINDVCKKKEDDSD